MNGFSDGTDFDSGELSENAADGLVEGTDGLVESADSTDMDTVLTGEGSMVSDFGDYPVEEDEAEMGDSIEPEMELDGNAIGSAGGEDIGIGSGMDTSGGESPLSGGNQLSGKQVSVQSGGIISEIGGDGGVMLPDSFDAGGQDYTTEGRSLHTNDGLDRENRGYQSEGYHDFDGPIHQNTSSTMDTDHSLNGLNTEEVRSQDRRNGAETRKSWEVPKSREELNQRNQKNHRRNEDDFLT